MHSSVSPDGRSGGLASGQSIWLSLVCKGKVEMLLRGLSFLKERENIREKSGKGRQRMFTTIFIIYYAVKGSIAFRSIKH